MSGTITSSAALFFNYWFILFELVTGITFAGMLIAVAVPMPPVSGIVPTRPHPSQAGIRSVVLSGRMSGSAFAELLVAVGCELAAEVKAAKPERFVV